MGRTAVLATAVAAFFVGMSFVPAAQADGIEEYSALRTAQTLDDLCRVLKLVERKVVDQASWVQIRTTAQYGFWQTDPQPRCQNRQRCR